MDPRNPFMDLTETGSAVTGSTATATLASQANQDDAQSAKSPVSGLQLPLQDMASRRRAIELHNLLVRITRCTLLPPNDDIQSSADRELVAAAEPVIFQGQSKLNLSCVGLRNVVQPGQSSSMLITLDNVDQVLLDRLTMQDLGPSDLVQVPVWTSQGDMSSLVSDERDNPSGEKRNLIYLYATFQRLQHNASGFTVAEITQLQEILIRQSSLFLAIPDMYPTQVASPLLELIDEVGHLTDEATLQRFIQLLTADIVRKKQIGELDLDLKDLVQPVYNQLNKRFSALSISSSSQLALEMRRVTFLTAGPEISLVLVQLNTPSDRNTLKWITTLFCQMLSVSNLPRMTRTAEEFFRNPSRSDRHEHKMTENNIAGMLSNHVNELFGIFRSLLKPATREPFMAWIGGCLNVFQDRKKMWTQEMLLASGSGPSQTDGLVLNLSAVLLKLSAPFATPYKVNMLKIDPRYCSASAKLVSKVAPPSNQPANRATGQPVTPPGPGTLPTDGAHIWFTDDENYLIPNINSSITNDETTSQENIPSSFNFMTECFFATHQALSIGFKVVHERFLRIAQDCNHVQQAYEEARSQLGGAAASGPGSPLEEIQNTMDRLVGTFLNLKAALTEPNTLELMFQFHIATAAWLNNVALWTESEWTEAQQLDRGFLKPAGLFPLADDRVSPLLTKIPEWVLENVADMVTFCRRFKDSMLGSPQFDLKPLMEAILIFMGSPNRAKNPHLRAHLAEVLECLKPDTSDRSPGGFTSSFAVEMSGRLFLDGDLVPAIVPALLHVFVSIEVSGQGVAFEQKFQYRRPMYEVLEYLWGIDVHKSILIKLASDAEKNMEAENAPIFLRFINLLINDAIFLLDEALQYMSKLKDLERARDSGEWARLPSDQARRQQEGTFQHMTRIAKFHNVMGLATIHTLAWLTEDVKLIFTHPTLVDRIAPMLNYFLIHLVGEKQKQFAVKAKEDYYFKPVEIVSEISRIYLNLGSVCEKSGDRADEFCRAVARDERSYSRKLLPTAANILQRKMKPLAPEMDELARRIAILGEEAHAMEIDDADVPDEFLDELMSSLMRDPVILPSGHHLDRTTIARHLLSDQTNPFTREPLSMEQVIPDTELKKRIDEFVREKTAEKSGSASAAASASTSASGDSSSTS